MAAVVLNDFMFKLPMDEIRRTVQVDVGHPRHRAVFADEVPHAVVVQEIAAVGMDRFAVGVGPCHTVRDGGPLGTQRISTKYQEQSTEERADEICFHVVSFG